MNNESGQKNGISAIKNKIGIIGGELGIKDIQISVDAIGDSANFIIIYQGDTHEVFFTKHEIDKANGGHFTINTLEKIQEIFESKNAKNIEPGGGGPIQ